MAKSDHIVGDLPLSAAKSVLVVWVELCYVRTPIISRATAGGKRPSSFCRRAAHVLTTETHPCSRSNPRY